MNYTSSQAEIVALQALSWLASEEDLLMVFLGATGASVDDLRIRAGDAEFLGSILDFLMNDDAWVMRFCDSVNLPYDAPMHARTALPGGAQFHWT